MPDPRAAARAVKICNNMMLAVSMIGVCEGFTLAQKLGLTPQTLFDVVQQIDRPMLGVDRILPGAGAGAGRRPPTATITAGFTAAMMLKDLRLAQQAAGRPRRRPRSARAAAALYQLLCRRREPAGSISRRSIALSPNRTVKI